MTGTIGFAQASSASNAALRRLQLLVNRRLDGLLQGDYLGLLPGPGSEPGESREYRAGDDVRRMDWPVTARTTVPHVRQTEADRELETWLAVDLSASLDFGTAQHLKRDLVLAAAAALTNLTVRGGNRVGVLIATGGGGGRASETVTSGGRASPTVRPRIRRLPARPGRRAAQGLLRAIATTPTAPGTVDLAALVEGLNRPPRRRGLAVVISDFLSPPEGWLRPVRKLAVRHDVLAIEVLDPRELALPDVGVLELVDPETGAVHEVQTGNRALREQYAQAATQQRAGIEAALRRAGAAHLRLRTDADWLTDIVRFVASRRHARTRGAARGATVETQEV